MDGDDVLVVQVDALHKFPALVQLPDTWTKCLTSTTSISPCSGQLAPVNHAAGPVAATSAPGLRFDTYKLTSPANSRNLLDIEDEEVAGVERRLGDHPDGLARAGVLGGVHREADLAVAVDVREAVVDAVDVVGYAGVVGCPGVAAEG